MPSQLGQFGVERVSDITSEPITFADVQANSRIDSSGEQTLVENMIIAARMLSEKYLHRTLMTETKVLSLDGFPRAGLIKIPEPPLQAVSEIRYKPTRASNWCIWNSDNYHWDAISEPGRVMPNPGLTWPLITLRSLGCVRVEYVAGYGLAADIPQPIKQAMLMLVSHWFENREASTDFVPRPVQFSFESLMMSYRWGDLH